MKKPITLLLVIPFLFLLAAACGTEEGETPAESADASGYAESVQSDASLPGEGGSETTSHYSVPESAPFVPIVFPDLDISGYIVKPFGDDSNVRPDGNIADIDKVIAGHDGKYGYINGEGRTVIPVIYDSAYAYYGADVVLVSLNGLYGLFDREGNEIVPIVYDGISGFKDGYAIVRANGERNDQYGDYYNSSHGIVDCKGNLILTPKYEYITYYGDLYFAVCDQGKWGLVRLPDLGIPEYE